ncbi:MAG: Type II secretion system protein D [Stenotrophomonas maltophilia]|uniref:Type II secretion system protein D n=1 Tax=Stenotrophomonas maltophilia TaxID=40324 RepID=A0A7V8FIX7_STEMA|nr:MAG: Type II secretion system protein D [Stenotrophomonas maltophilia]
MKAWHSLLGSTTLALLVAALHLPAAAQAQAQAAAARDEAVQLNLVDTDIGGVLRMAARFTGRQFLIDPRVTGKMTVVSDGSVSRVQAYQLLLGALCMRGYAVVETGGVSRVVPQADAKLLGGQVGTGGAGGEVVTRTFPLRYENATALVAVLRPMISADNPITANPGNNTLVITDYADNLERIARVIASVDTPAGMDTDVVKLQQGIATDVAAMVSPLLDAQGAETSQKVVVIADPRSNSILLRSSSPGRTRLALQLVEKLDRAQDESGNLHVVYLRNAQATQLAGVLGGGVAGQTDAAAMGSTEGSTPGGAEPMRNAPPVQATAQKPKSAIESALLGDGKEAAGESATGFSHNGISVQPDTATNTLLISAPEPVYRNLRRVIDQLDQRRAQVLVESLIVEVTQNDAAELGVQWMLGNGRTFGGTHFGGSSGGSGINTTARTTLDVLPRDGLNVGVIDGTINLPGVGQVLNLKALANALQSRGGANILSTPNLMTLDNEAASIMVGQTVPFVSGRYVTDGGGGNNPFQTIERQDIGLKLKVRPQISEGGTVKLDIYQEVSSIDAANSNTSAGIITNKRALDTSVLLDDGQIMVLGGLLEDSVSRPRRGARARQDSGTGRAVPQRYPAARQDQPDGVPAPARGSRPGGRPAPDPRPLRLHAQRAGRRAAGIHLGIAGHDRTAAATAGPAGAGAGRQPQRGRAAGAGQCGHAVRLGRQHRAAGAVRAGPGCWPFRTGRGAGACAGLQAFAEAAPGGEGQRLRVRLPRDPKTLDPALQLLRTLGYVPELVIGP